MVLRSKWVMWNTVLRSYNIRLLCLPFVLLELGAPRSRLLLQGLFLRQPAALWQRRQPGVERHASEHPSQVNAAIWSPDYRTWSGNEKPNAIVVFNPPVWLLTITIGGARAAAASAPTSQGTTVTTSRLLKRSSATTDRSSRRSPPTSGFGLFLIYFCTVSLGVGGTCVALYAIHSVSRRTNQHMKVHW